MALTRDFKETVAARLQSDATYREAMLTEAVNAFVGGDIGVGKALLRDYINATLGFEALAEASGLPVKSLHRMFGQSGNPTLANFTEVLRVLQKAEGIDLTVRSHHRAA